MSTRQPDPEAHCQQCGRQLQRKRFPGGRLESLHRFKQRKFCDLTCCGASQRGPDFDDSPLL